MRGATQRPSRPLSVVKASRLTTAGRSSSSSWTSSSSSSSVSSPAPWMSSEVQIVLRDNMDEKRFSPILSGINSFAHAMGMPVTELAKVKTAIPAEIEAGALANLAQHAAAAARAYAGNTEWALRADVRIFTAWCSDAGEIALPAAAATVAAFIDAMAALKAPATYGATSPASPPSIAPPAWPTPAKPSRSSWR